MRKNYKEFYWDERYVTEYTVFVNYPKTVKIQKIIEDVEQYGNHLGTVVWEIWKFKAIIKFYEVDRRIIGKDIYITRHTEDKEERWYQVKNINREEFENLLSNDFFEEIEKVINGIKAILNQEIMKELEEELRKVGIQND